MSNISENKRPREDEESTTSNITTAALSRPPPLSSPVSLPSSTTGSPVGPGALAPQLSLAQARLREERKTWRREKPFGFWARPVQQKDGSLDLLRWEAGIPGREGTPWEGGEYFLTMQFSEDYPSKPPKCQFKPVLFHPNIYPSGTVCLSILNEEKDWRPSITVKQMLVAIQTLLDNPNALDPAQKEPLEAFQKDKALYEAEIRRRVKDHPIGGEQRRQ